MVSVSIALQTQDITPTQPQHENSLYMILLLLRLALFNGCSSIFFIIRTGGGSTIGLEFAQLTLKSPSTCKLF